MSDSNERRIIRFDRLNPLGKAVYLTGAAIRTTAHLIDKTIERVVDIVIETEKAFTQGLDPNVEDAKILEEHEDHKP